jgi:arsenite methyltransferase
MAKHEATVKAKQRKRADYGIDAPNVLRNFALLGAGLIIVGVLVYLLLWPTLPGLAVALLNCGLWPGGWFLLTCAVMLWGSKVGKFRERDRLLDGIPWRGDEQVLDVGCGHGLLLIGTAKRLTTGKAVGIDRWQKEDQAGNSPEATRANVELEGVADRVEIQSGDARELPFADASFDVVVSSWALHNIYAPAERQRAVREIARVLRPGGRVALLDIRHTREYAEILRECGLSDVRRSGPRWLFVIPTHAVVGSKPQGSVQAGSAT